MTAQEFRDKMEKIIKYGFVLQVPYKEIKDALLVLFREAGEGVIYDMMEHAFTEERKKGFDLGIDMYFRALRDVRKRFTEMTGGGK